MYIDPAFDHQIAGPPRVHIQRQEYFRFMDFFYIPCLPYKLSQDEVIEICDLRLEYLPKVVDVDLNKVIVDYMTQTIHRRFVNKVEQLRVLDFGCGSGLSSRLIIDSLGNVNLKGFDASENAVKNAFKNGVDARFAPPGNAMPFADESFDVVFAVFVMHFSIEKPSLDEIYRVLTQPGILVYNYYKQEPPLLRSFLAEIGFMQEQIFYSDLPKNHSITLCRKK